MARYKMISVTNDGSTDLDEVATEPEVITALGAANNRIGQALFWVFDTDPLVNTWFIQNSY